MVMESLARVRAGIAGIVVGVIVIVVGLLTSGLGDSSASSEGLGWPVIVGAILLVGGAALLVLGLRNKRTEERELAALRADETRDNADDRPL
jgi:predicted phage tail protein